MKKEVPRRFSRWLAPGVTAMLVALACAAPMAWTRRFRAAGAEPAGEIPRISEEKSGTLTTREGRRLRLVTDVGNVRIFTEKTDGDASRAPLVARYRVRVEADAREPDAKNLLKQFVLTARKSPAGAQLNGTVPWHGFRGRLWVSYEVWVPRRYNLEVVTQAGNIETQDLDGRASLFTAGGNITAGSVGGPEAAGVSLETRGGHVTVQNVKGDLRAVSAGGHITVANVEGDAVLRTAGGHIRAGWIRGTAQLETGGGNISVERAGGGITASTGGGQIDLGEASGAIRARTAGGGIRIQRVTGPTVLESSGGSILLTQVPGAVRASTVSGTITAWFAAQAPKARPAFLASQLESGQGDIVVYLPPELPVTIEATIERSAEHRIEADPSLPLKVSYFESGSGGRTVRGECALNGGGELLRLKTGAGNIRLKLADSASLLRLNQKMMEQLQRRMDLPQRLVQRELERHAEEIRQQVEEQSREVEHQAEEAARQAWRLEDFRHRIEQMWLGAIRAAPQAQQRKLVHSVAPVYPDVARQAGVEGAVRLRAVIAGDGSMREVKVISGDPVLAEAAQQAVRQWRYQPTLLDGKPVNVITTVVVEFRLR